MTSAVRSTSDRYSLEGSSESDAPLGWRAVGALIGGALAWTGLLIVLIVVARFGLGTGETFTLNLVAAVIPVHGLGLIALIIWQFRRHDRRLADLNGRSLSARTFHLFWQVPVMWIALLVSIAVMLPVLESFGDSSAGGAESTMADVNALMAVAVFVGVALVAPVWEELFFRGIVYRGLRVRRGVVIAALLSSLVFALVHSVALMVPYFFVMAVAMALIYEFHQNIWAPIVAHVFVNVPVSGGTLLAVL